MSAAPEAGSKLETEQAETARQVAARKAIFEAETIPPVAPAVEEADLEVVDMDKGVEVTDADFETPEAK